MLKSILERLLRNPLESSTSDGSIGEFFIICALILINKFNKQVIIGSLILMRLC